MAIVYRVENPNTFQGLWYDKNGNFNPFITKIPNALCKDLPMDFNPEFKVGGLDWYSACDSLDDMSTWFSREDLINLSAAGYNLYQFNVSNYRTVFGHAAFARDHVSRHHQLDLSVLTSRMG